ncbi:MAG TPA: SCP2 sterol-binding domain-containing protein [Acidimicrobiia bacterium]|nr:SCP2 sterol-binding domain-containing protein [Acidimicrobiia bacterium]
MATFLSTDWLADLTTALNAHAGFKGAIANVDLTLQFAVTDAPVGTEGRYFVDVAEGKALAAPGDADEPDATITNTYETSVAMSKGELNTQMAFMTGKIKVTGNMAKLMMNQSMLNQFAAAASGVKIEY